jgi:CelD/BcsL family acetyltransferase involved in cellulose biosynthesis
VLRCSGIPADSPLLAAARAGGARVRRRVVRQQFGVDLAAFLDFRAYLRQTGKSLPADHARRVRRLREAGALELRRETGEAGLTVLPWLLDTKRGWLEETGHQAQWLAAGYIDDFLDRLLRMPDAPPWWVATLRLDGRIIAAKLCYAERGLWVFSKSARDPAESRYSPSRTLTLLLIEAACAEGIGRIDLGTTGEKWKAQIATTHVETLAVSYWLT